MRRILGRTVVCRAFIARQSVGRDLQRNRSPMRSLETKRSAPLADAKVRGAKWGPREMRTRRTGFPAAAANVLYECDELSMSGFGPALTPRDPDTARAALRMRLVAGRTRHYCAVPQAEVSKRSPATPTASVSSRR